MMATKKKKVHIKVFPSVGQMNVYCDDPNNCIQDVEEIEGIRQAYVPHTSDYILVLTDPRYDINEIADEVEELLTAEVPDVFNY